MQTRCRGPSSGMIRSKSLSSHDFWLKIPSRFCPPSGRMPDYRSAVAGQPGTRGYNGRGGAVRCEEAGMAKKKKVRIELRKNRNGVPRENAWTRKFDEQDATVEDSPTSGERVRARGDLSRRRTIIQDDT